MVFGNQVHGRLLVVIVHSIEHDDKPIHHSHKPDLLLMILAPVRIRYFMFRAAMATLLSKSGLSEIPVSTRASRVSLNGGGTDHGVTLIEPVAL